MEELISDLDKALYLQNMLISRSTGGNVIDSEYESLRKYFIDQAEIAKLLPEFIKDHRDLFQFWQFIKYKYAHYAERRDFIYNSFMPLLQYLELRSNIPSDSLITENIKVFDAEHVYAVWDKALKRREKDPEGALTTARTLLETICKHILDESQVAYDRNKIKLPKLCDLTANKLNLAPSQHTEEAFKRILGGIYSIVDGLGSLRSLIGDSHGQGKRPVKPSPRHSAFAINLAGTLSLFLIETWNYRKEKRDVLTKSV